MLFIDMAFVIEIVFIFFCILYFVSIYPIYLSIGGDSLSRVRPRSAAHAHQRGARRGRGNQVNITLLT